MSDEKTTAMKDTKKLIKLRGQQERKFLNCVNDSRAEIVAGKGKILKSLKSLRQHL